MFHIQASHSPVDDSWGQPGPLPLPGRDRNTHCQELCCCPSDTWQTNVEPNDDVDGDEESSPNRSAQFCCCLFWVGRRAKNERKTVSEIDLFMPGSLTWREFGLRLIFFLRVKFTPPPRG